MAAPIVLTSSEIAELSATYAGYTIDQAAITEMNWSSCTFLTTNRCIRCVINPDNTIVIKQLFMPLLFKKHH